MSVLSHVEPGDTIQIDGRNHVVHVVVTITDEVVTEDGVSIFMEELERIPMGGDLAAWLDGPTFRRKHPKEPPHHSMTVRCGGSGDCTCTYCYAVIDFDINNTIIDRHHFKDAPACRCRALLDPCECL